MVIGQVPAVTRYVEERVPQEPPLSEKVDYDEAAKIAKTDKRVTPEIIDRAIGQVHYWHLAGTTTTICALVLHREGRDGWVVVGTSGCYDPANYNPVYGRTAAYENARRKVFDFIAYKEHVALRTGQ